MLTTCLPLKHVLPISGMCPGLGEWWLHKEVLNLQNLIWILNL